MKHLTSCHIGFTLIEFCFTYSFQHFYNYIFDTACYVTPIDPSLIPFHEFVAVGVAAHCLP